MHPTGAELAVPSGMLRIRHGRRHQKMTDTQPSVGLVFDGNGLELIDPRVEFTDRLRIVVLPENEEAPQVELVLLFVRQLKSRCSGGDLCAHLSA